MNEHLNRTTPIELMTALIALHAAFLGCTACSMGYQTELLCGNGVVDPGEECDGEPGCLSDCRFRRLPIRISYLFFDRQSTGLDCVSAEVARLDVTLLLNEPLPNEDPVVSTVQTLCKDQEIVFSDIPPGGYLLLFSAFDEEGHLLGETTYPRFEHGAVLLCTLINALIFVEPYL